MAFIALCRRNGVEFTTKILCRFFTPLWMNDNVISLRPRRNQVILFDSLPYRVEYKGRWVAGESKIGFPFRPLIGQCRRWDSLPSNVRFSPSELKIIKVIAETLGEDPQSQTKVYSFEELLSGESLAWCGIGSSLEARRAELGFEEPQEYPSWTLHPGRVFSSECEICRVPESEGCQTAHGR